MTILIASILTMSLIHLIVLPYSVFLLVAAMGWKTKTCLHLMIAMTFVPYQLIFIIILLALKIGTSVYRNCIIAIKAEIEMEKNEKS